jgi:hypothetical protein
MKWSDIGNVLSEKVCKKVSLLSKGEERRKKRGKRKRRRRRRKEEE